MSVYALLIFVSIVFSFPAFCQSSINSVSACEDLLSRNAEEALVCCEILMAQSSDTVEISIIKGQALRRLGRIWEAKNYFETLLDLILTERQNAEIHNNLGKVNANLSLYDEAAEAFLYALEIMERLDDREGQAFYLNNIGIIYDLQEDYSNALKYYQRSLELKVEMNMKSSLPASYTNIGVTLYNLGQVDSSLYYHEKALVGFRQLDKKSSIARSMNNIGFALIDLSQYQKAEAYLTDAMVLRDQLGDQRGVAQTRSNLARLYFLQEKIEKAWSLSKQSASDALELGLPEILRQAWSIQQELYVAQRQYKEAYGMSVQLDSLEDKIAVEERSKKVAELEARYQNVKKEQELKESRLLLTAQTAELKSEVVKRNALLLISFALLITTLTATFGYRQKNRAGRLFAAQNVLLKKEKTREENLRAHLSSELDQTRLDLEEKNKILNQVYTFQPEKLPPHFKELSAREKEVLSYLALGWSDKEIAEGLYVSVTTVKTHLRRVYSKLLVKGRAEAVALAHKHGIIGELQLSEHE